MPEQKSRMRTSWTYCSGSKVVEDMINPSLPLTAATSLLTFMEIRLGNRSSNTVVEKEISEEESNYDLSLSKNIPAGNFPLRNWSQNLIGKYVLLPLPAPFPPFLTVFVHASSLPPHPLAITAALLPTHCPVSPPMPPSQKSWLWDYLQGIPKWQNTSECPALLP